MVSMERDFSRTAFAESAAEYAHPLYVGCNNPVGGSPLDWLANIARLKKATAHPLQPVIAFNIPVRRFERIGRTEGGQGEPDH